VLFVYTTNATKGLLIKIKAQKQFCYVSATPGLDVAFVNRRHWFDVTSIFKKITKCK